VTPYPLPLGKLAFGHWITAARRRRLLPILERHLGGLDALPAAPPSSWAACSPVRSICW